MNNNSNHSNAKTLLQPLKSFGTSSNQQPPSSMSIPNTPAKYCDNNNLANMIRSPVKKQLLVSLAPNQTNQTSIGVTRGSGYNLNNKSTDILTKLGKSNENIFERKLSTTSNSCNSNNNNNNNNEELTAEMANLEGIMKDLNAITAQQFEC
jgi:hypothetical protein